MKADTANRSAKRTGTRTSMWDNIFKMKHMLNYYYDNKNNASAYLASIIIFDFYISIDTRIFQRRTRCAQQPYLEVTKTTYCKGLMPHTFDQITLYPSEAFVSLLVLGRLRGLFRVRGSDLFPFTRPSRATTKKQGYMS